MSTPPSDQWFRQLRLYAKWTAILLLLYLMGPVIFSAKQTQKRTAGRMWQADKRWAQVNGSALFSLLVYIPIALFHGPLATAWTSLFATSARGLHLPVLAWLAGTSLLPPLPSSLLLRWLLALPLAPLLAIGIEMVQPRTAWQTKRIISPEEQQERDAIAAAQEQKKLKAAARKTNTPPTAAAKKPRTSAVPKKQSPPLPKPDSLWGSVDWKTVPDDHPLKQAVRDEAARLDTQRREQARTTWLTQQQASFNPPPATNTPSPSPAGDDYNWDEGEGSLQE